MKKLLLNFFIILTLIVSAIPVSAETSANVTVESRQTAAAEITIEGDFTSDAANSEIAIYVFKSYEETDGTKKSYTINDLAVGENQTSVLLYHGQTTADANGKFTFVFGVGENITSGYYVAKLASSKPFIEKEHTLYYKSEGDIKRASAAFKAAADAEDYTAFKNTFNTYSKVLGIGQTVPGVGIDVNSVCQVLYDYYTKNTVDTSDADKCIEIIQFCEVLSAVYDKKITDLFHYSSLLGIDDSRLKDFLAAPYVTSGFKESVTAKIASADVKNPAAILENIYEAFVLTAVYDPISYTNLPSLLKEFNSEIGVEDSAITDSVCLNIAGETYASYANLGSAIKNPGGGSAGGGSAGGGGSTGGGGGGGSAVGGSSNEIVSVEDKDIIVPEKIPTTIFDDLDSVVWAEDAIVYLAENNVINGKGDNKFCPNDSITREEFAKILTLVFFSGAEPAQISFVDVPYGEWYYNSVAVAYGTGIVKGISDTRFGTGEKITRQDAAVMVCRTAEKAGLWVADEISFDKQFYDDAQIGDYAKDAVYTLYNKKVVNGTGNGEFNPNAQMTRAEAAKMIYELLNV